MTRDEYNRLFHKLRLNEVAFKRLMDCDEEVLKLVNFALDDETMKRKRLRKKCDSLIESLKEMIELWEDDPAYGAAIVEKARNTIADAEGA